LGLGLLILNANGDPSDECLSRVRSLFSGIMDRQGRPRIDFGHIDVGGIAYTALRMHELTGDGAYLALANRFGETLLATPGTEDGTIPYNSRNAYVLVDTVAFICPFLARLSRHTSDPTHAAIAVRQLDTMWHHGHAMSPWIQHGFRRDDLQAVGSCQWGRGLGWMILGLVDTLTELPVSPERLALLTRTISLLDGLTSAQLSSGHFPLMLDSIDTTPDSSLTAIVAYSLARLKQAGLNHDDHYDVLLTSCRAALDASTWRDGRVFDCSSEAGGIAEYSSQLGHHLWAQGPTVACDAILDHLSP